MAVKSRSREADSQYTRTFSCPVCGSWAGSTAPVVSRAVSTESIMTFNSAGTWKEHPCRHLKETFTLDYTWSAPKTYETHVHDGKTYSISCVSASNVAYSPDLWYPPGTSYQVPTGDFEDFAESAYKAMRPTMSSSVSLANFLLELRDFKQMFKIYDRYSSLFKNSANAHLNWTFGWKPFLSDIKKMFKGMATFETRLAEFINREGVPQRRHFQKSMEVDQVISPWSLTWNSLWKHRYVVDVSELLYSATYGYTYDYPNYTSNNLRIRALLDTFGLNQPASIIWNAIPFSWLVDWFINVGDLISSMESDLTNPKMTFSLCMYSRKVKGSVRFEGEPWQGQGNPVVTYASCDYSLYERWHGVPRITPELSVDPDLNFGQLSIATSLLYSRYGK